MDAEKLLLAAKIRELAVVLREAERHPYSISLRDYRNEEKRAVELANWDAQNPVWKYIPHAIKELDNIAKLVESFDGLAPTN